MLSVFTMIKKDIGIDHHPMSVVYILAVEFSDNVI